MRDFRDCACFYWASNHPDIVLRSGPAALCQADRRQIHPLQRHRSIGCDRSPERTAAALGTEQQNRAAQMDHYEINQRWQDLSIVLLGQEMSRVFQPRPIETATPFPSPNELAQNLKRLAGLEHAVMLEYLYAIRC
jgi:hypothetical protein